MREQRSGIKGTANEDAGGKREPEKFSELRPVVVPASGSVENGGEAWFAGGWRAAARQRAAVALSEELRGCARGLEEGHRERSSIVAP